MTRTRVLHGSQEHFSTLLGGLSLEAPVATRTLRVCISDHGLIAKSSLTENPLLLEGMLDQDVPLRYLGVVPHVNPSQIKL